MYKKNLVFAAASIGILFFGISLITLGSVAPDLKKKFLLDDISSGTLFSILPIGILVGSLLFGPVCDRYGYKWLMVGASILMFVGFEGIAWSGSFILLQISIFIFGVSGGAINGATNAAVSDISSGSKGANLSLLGVFFGIGALGMPFILGSLKSKFNFEEVISAIGFLTLAVAIFYSFISFPPSKKEQGFPILKARSFFQRTVSYPRSFFFFFVKAVSKRS